MLNCNLLRCFFITIWLVFFNAVLFAQKDTVTFLLSGVGAAADNIFYLAGNVNGWKPNDNNYLFKKNNDGTFYLTTIFDKATLLEFKITKGSWDKVECNNDGTDIANRILKTDTVTTTNCKIQGWVDQLGKKQKPSTASAGVVVLNTSFFIPQLNRNRRIWVYLPPGYAKTKERYPVLYMHDGQNLFDEQTAGFGKEWGVDETLDSLIARGKTAAIVIGIDNGGETRMSEYNPYTFTWKGESAAKTFLPEGDMYLQFIIETLKPYIDKNYRTLSAKEHTVIAGSSMGGLISYYAALKYPQVFGKAGVFSPAFWTAPQIKQLTDAVTTVVSSKFFFYMGQNEGSQYVEDMNEVVETLGTNSAAMIYSVVDNNGVHNEIFWRKWFSEFYVWVMADGYNNVIKVEE